MNIFLRQEAKYMEQQEKNCTSQSTTQARYYNAIVNCINIVWIKVLLKGKKEEIIEPVTLYCNNTSVVNISKKIVMHTKTKHIAIKYHYLRELIQEKEVMMEYVNTN